MAERGNSWFGGKQRPQMQLLEPRDVDVYVFRQRLAKLTADAKTRSHAHRAESRGYKWLFFLCGLMPGAFLSCLTSLMAAGFQHDDIKHRDSIIMVLGILNAIVVAMGGFWNWQGTEEQHASTSKSFERLHTTAQQMNIRWEQQSTSCTPDYEALNRMYSDIGGIYEEAPLLGFRATRLLAWQLNKDTDDALFQIDLEERTEDGIGRFRRPDAMAQNPSAMARFAVEGSPLPPLKVSQSFSDGH